MYKNIKTDFLVTKPSFLRGVANVLDIASVNGKKYNSSESEEAADSKAILSDWVITGEDMRWALNEYEEKTK